MDQQMQTESTRRDVGESTFQCRRCKKYATTAQLVREADGKSLRHKNGCPGGADASFEELDA